MSINVSRTLEKLQKRVSEGEYYEAHQMYRTIANRYVKAREYDLAARLLLSGSELLLEQKQVASGGDLAIYLIDVFKQSSKPPDAAIRSAVSHLLELMPSTDPIKKKYISEIVQWMSTSDFPAGDPQLHHLIGCNLMTDYDGQAENHFLLGTQDSCIAYARMLFECFEEDEAHTAPLYIGRAVLQFLRLKNIEFATKSLDIFIQLLKRNESLPRQELISSQSEMVVFPTFPLLNFLRLLIFTAQRQNNDLFSKLKNHYQTAINETPSWNDNLTKIAEIYFGQRPARKGNMFSDLLEMLAPPPSNPSLSSVKQDDLD